MEIVAGGSGASLVYDYAALREYDSGAYTFLQSVIARKGLSNTSEFVVDEIPAGRVEHTIYTQRINYICSINVFLRSLNRKLVHGGTFIGCFESNGQRRERILSELPVLLAYPLYYVVYVYWKKLVSSLPLFRKMHRTLTGGVDRVLSKTEVLGRLVYCGFDICYYKEVEGLTWFYAEKKDFPKRTEPVSNRTIVKLSRIGRNGTYRKYYKLRTMYPYSEYLHEYILNKNGTINGDKPADDFRVTRLGVVLRRYWLDEVPMLWNYVKGDLKLVGVRPISDQKFQTYPDWLQKKRIKYKPGLIPPFYADLPKTVEEFAETESRYLDLYEKAPIKTDVIYFFKALYNILFKGARSG